MTEIPPPGGSAVDRDNPWPGLASFTEELRGFFFGREKETEELVRLVRRNALTVLFGQSGLGKSSLLQAGVFPLLREADFLPLYLRLDHDPATPPLAEQVKAALMSALREAGADAPEPGADQTLWEYFHRKDIDIWSAKNRLLTPVLAFDQFEEIFTLGRADDARRDRGRAFLTELADLVENRPPAPLQAKLDSGELDPAKFAFDKPSCRVILSLREDFLPELEGLRGEMRSLLLDRMRVKRLTGTQALEIVSRPAPHLLADGVAERIVEFVAGARGGSAERLAELEVEPALLSVICRELNQRRRALGQDRIAADLVSGNRREILTDFYERSVADLPAAMREFVEDRLLTKSGFRDNLALETALEAPGVTRALIDTLVARRLLRIEDRLGVQRVELTHDVLADVIRASRDSRQQRLALEAARERERHARRRIWWLRGTAAGLVLLLAGVSLAAYRSGLVRDRRTARSDLDFAAQLMEHGDAPAAIAHLVRAAEEDPGNTAAGTRLISALARQSWPIWRDLGIAWRDAAPSPNHWLGLTSRGDRLLVLGGDGVVRLVDLPARRLIREYRFPRKVIALGLAPGNSGVFAVGLEGGGGAVGSMAAAGFHPISGVERHPSPDGLVRGVLSPDGRWLAIVDGSKLFLVETGSGRTAARVELPAPANPASLNFSPDSTRLVLADWKDGVGFFRVPTLAMTAPWSHPSEFNIGGAGYAVFSPDGALCAVSWWEGVRLLDAKTGLPDGPALPVTTQSDFLQFGPNGRRLFVFGNDRTVRIFDVATRRETVPPLRHGAEVQDGQLSADGRILLTWSNDDQVRLWDTFAGTQLGQPIADVPWSQGVALEPDGRHVLACAPDGRLGEFGGGSSSLRPIVWRPGGEPPRLFSSGGVFPFMTFFFPGRDGALFHWGARRLLTLSPDSFREAEEKLSVPAKATIQDLSFSDAGAFLLSFPGAGFSVWGAADGRRIADLAGSPADDADIEGIFLPNGGPIIIGAFPAGGLDRVRLWPARGGRPLGPEIDQRGLSSTCASVSPGGARLALGTASGWAGIWDIATGRLTARLHNDLNAEVSIAQFSPNGRYLATGSYPTGASADGTSYSEARLWDAKTGRPISGEFRHREDISGIGFSPDSRLVAFASADGTIDVASTATGKALYPSLALPGATPVVSAALNPTGILAFTDSNTILAATDGAACLWDARSGVPAMDPYPAGAAYLAHLSLNGTATDVALVDHDGNASVWPLPPRYARGEVPPWLLELARTLAGERLDRDGNLVPLRGGFAGAQAALADVRRRLDALPKDAPYAAWGRWILADPETRGIAPGLAIPYAEAKARGLAE